MWITTNCKILKEIGLSGLLICLLRNPYSSQEATIRTVRGTTGWFQIVKGVQQGCLLSPWLFNLYAEYIMWSAGHKLESRLLAESKEELKSLLMKVKESEKAGLKFQHSNNEDDGIRSHHFMANRWGNNGNSERLYILGLQNHGRWWLQLWN